MRRYFNPFPRSLAGFLTCTAIVLASASESKSAIVSPAALAARQGPDLIVDWNEECIAQDVANVDEDQYSALPDMMPEDFDAADADAAVATQSVSDDSPTSNDIDASDDRASQVSDPNSYSDYYRFKFGHSDRPYGDNAQSNDAAKPADDDTAKPADDDAAKPAGDDTTPADDANDIDSSTSHGDGASEQDADRDAMPAENSKEDTANNATENDATGNNDAAIDNTENSDIKDSDSENSDSANIEAPAVDEAAPTETEQTHGDCETIRPQDYDLSYLQNKLGEYGQYFGKMLNVAPVEPQSTGDTARNDDTAKSDDATSDDEMADAEANKRGELADAADMPKDDSVAADQNAADKSDAPAPDDASRAADDTSASDVSENIQNYYRYHYEPLEDRYGRDASGDADAKQDENSPSDEANHAADGEDDSSVTKDGDDSTSDDSTSDDSANDDSSSEESTNDDSAANDSSSEESASKDSSSDDSNNNDSTSDQGGDDSVLADALLGAASHCIGEYVAHWGVSTTEIARALTWVCY